MELDPETRSRQVHLSELRRPCRVTGSAHQRAPHPPAELAGSGDTEGAVTWAGPIDQSGG